MTLLLGEEFIAGSEVEVGWIDLRPEAALPGRPELIAEKAALWISHSGARALAPGEIMAGAWEIRQP